MFPPNHSFVTGNSAYVDIWSLDPLEIVKSTKQSNSVIRGTCVVDDRYVISNRPTHIWDLETNILSPIRPTIDRSLNRMCELAPVPSCFGGFSTLFAGVSQEGPAYIFTADDGGKEVAKTEAGRNAVVSDVRYSDEMRSLYFAHDDGRVWSWSIESDKTVLLGNAGGGQITGLAIDEERKMVFAGNRWAKTFFGFSLMMDSSVENRPDTSCKLTEGPMNGIIDMVYHPESQNLFILDSHFVLAYDVRNLSCARACFRVHLCGYSSWPSEIAQVTDEVFVSVNCSTEVSAWSIHGKVVASKTARSTPSTVSSPYSQNKRVSQDSSRVLKEEVDRVLFAIDFLTDERVIAIQVGSTKLLSLKCMLWVEM